MTVETPLAGRRVAIVCGHFSPEIGYQEVDLAKAFTRIGARVRVFTSTRPSRNARAVIRENYPDGLTRIDTYDVVRLRARLMLGANVIGCRVMPAIRDFAPDHVVLIGPAKLFGLEVFSSDTPPWTRIAIIQDNSEDGRLGGSIGKRLVRAAIQRVVKRPAYRRVIRHADRIILNVPETRGIISPFLGERERSRLIANGLDLRLGFDPQEFYFDPEARRAWREKYNVPVDDLLLVTCTRAVPDKRLEDVIDIVASLQRRGRRVRYVLAGVLDNGYGRSLRSYVASQPDSSIFTLLPLLDHDEMRELFSAGDFGFWPRVAISIQQAMGTGLPMVLRLKSNVAHLVHEGQNGWYIEPGQNPDCIFTRAIEDISVLSSIERTSRRRECVDFNRSYLSYDVIAGEIIAGLRSTERPLTTADTGVAR